MYNFSVKTKLFSLSNTLTCGQCFRFFENEDGSFSGVALGRAIRIIQDNDSLLISGITEDVFQREYIPYFSLDIDYERILEDFCVDDTMRKVIGFAPGIRVMRQPLFETLISFIISQNNNIKRISGIISRFCNLFGEEKYGFFDFPEPEALSLITCNDLSPVRLGFRDKYIIDAISKWNDGKIDENYLQTAPLTEARKSLMQILGVGPKVADCTLLFGAARFDAFPEDVWVRRIMAELFPKGLPDCAKAYGGIAQQYLFHYARNRNI